MGRKWSYAIDGSMKNQEQISWMKTFVDTGGIKRADLEDKLFF